METEKKESSKLELIELEITSERTVITDIFQVVSNIEDKLGEREPKEEPKDKSEASTSRFEKMKHDLGVNNHDLREISDRLNKISDLL